MTTDDHRALLAALATGSLDLARPRALLLDHLSGRQPFAGYAARIARLFAIDLTACHRLLSALARPDAWHPYGPGMEVRPVQVGPALARPGVQAAFARYTPGGRMPAHGHSGDETTLVLAGGFVDERTGVHVLPGDTLLSPAGSTHSLLIDPGEPCLAAVRLLGPLLT